MSVIVLSVVRSHTVCSNLVLTYSILLRKIVTTIGTVPTAHAHDDHSYLSGRVYDNMNRDCANPAQGRRRRRNQRDREARATETS